MHQVIILTTAPLCFVLGSRSRWCQNDSLRSA